ncbi:energy transducer TonB family protein [Roseovarius amoyensis]|uniref:energy transducer TonB family protein n=1 Tax=Roseovarius amoyensis TaxID=2211448 RepID=UPI000DBE8064|nr:energy transducer TonB [Roseovarius amoyensis]
MIPRSPYVAVVSLGLAGALHAAIAVVPGGQVEVTAIEGGGGATISTLGDSFADMAAGAEVPEPETAMPAEVAEAPPPPVSETPPAETTAAAPSPETTQSPPPQAKRLAALAPMQDSAPPVPERAAPVEQAPAPTPEPAERIVAEPETPAPQVPARPKARPERPQPEQPRQQATPPPQRTVQQQPGNSKRDARAGDASGRETAQQQQAGPARTAAARSGNAAVTNYPGQVMRRIQRTRRERVNVRRAAQVSFTIAPNGGLAAVGIARSSGSAQLDRVALQQIRRAAPFPPPPAGAQRSFTLRIAGR